MNFRCAVWWSVRTRERPSGSRRYIRKTAREKTEGNVKVFSDRMDSRLFYGFGDHSDFYVSRDGGLTFHEKKLPAEFPVRISGRIDCADKTEVRGETGKTGVFYLALAEHGLWKLKYDCGQGEDGRGDQITVKRLSGEGDTVYCVGLGVGRPGGDYYTEDKALYVSGKIGGHYGFYRTLDEGVTFERLNTDRQQFGEVHSIDGDCRIFGRFSWRPAPTEFCMANLRSNRSARSARSLHRPCKNAEAVGVRPITKRFSTAGCRG